MKLSVIIPSYKEPFLQKTVDSFFKASQLGEEVEVIVVADGVKVSLTPDPRLKVLKLVKNVGMTGAVNAGIAESKGEYIMKVDAHCVFCDGFDKLMLADAEVDSLMYPRKYSVDENNWSRGRGRYTDYFYLCHPTKVLYRDGKDLKEGYMMTPQVWRKKNDKLIDETMSMQGSFWMANREYFMKNIGYHDNRPETYGPMAGDQYELGLKYWLNGGTMKVNKKVWYGHLCKTKRHYRARTFNRRHKGGVAKKHWVWATDHWTNDKEPNMKRKFVWLVEKFSPVPTWPENRKKWHCETH